MTVVSGRFEGRAILRIPHLVESLQDISGFS